MDQWKWNPVVLTTSSAVLISAENQSVFTHAPVHCTSDGKISLNYTLLLSMLPWSISWAIRWDSFTILLTGVPVQCRLIESLKLRYEIGISRVACRLEIHTKFCGYVTISYIKSVDTLLVSAHRATYYGRWIRLGEFEPDPRNRKNTTDFAVRTQWRVILDEKRPQ